MPPDEPFTVYKLVRRHDREDGRWLSSAADGRGQVVYLVDVPAEAPAWLARQGYHPLAFQTLHEAALAWEPWAGLGGYAVFEADAEGEVADPPPRASLYMLGLGKLVTVPQSQRWPVATVMARRLTLRRRVPEEELREW
jgi:hypothetical protein